VTGEQSRFAGRGLALWKGASAEGVVFDVSTPDDVMALIDIGLHDVILMIHTAAASMLAPLFSDLTGIICTTGDAGTDIAILSRQFGVPCLLNTQLLDEIAGRRVRIDATGEVHIVPGY
jgi:signal transduction protein with GAF and PtsI domain